MCQSRGFDIIALAPEIFSPRGSQLKGPPNGGLLFAFRSVQDCNSSGDIHRNLASSDLILIKLPIEPLWFMSGYCEVNERNQGAPMTTWIIKSVTDDPERAL